MTYSAYTDQLARITEMAIARIEQPADDDEEFLTDWTAEHWDADDRPMLELPALI